MCGGEALTPGIAGRLLEKTAALWNVYGPTEATVWATVQLVDVALLETYLERASMPIGEALPNVYTLVLDDRQNPVPDGAAGELYILGAGLARGYVGDPSLTAERFPRVRISPSRSERCYRTGDVVRREQGRIVFLHRRDQQIKFHGFRIEPAEIEMRIEAYRGVAHAAVELRNDGPEGPMLVAYVVAEGGPVDTRSLRAWLASRLPSYMVPQAFVNLPQLPTGTTGKLDRKALPPPSKVAIKTGSASAARTDTERKLLEILRDLLGELSISVDDSFFELGGHSLAAAKLFVRIARVFGVTLPLRTLSSAQTVAEIGAVIDAALGSKPAPPDRPPKPSLRHDAILPEHIQPQNTRPAAEATHILLTGATGFLGGYLLAELLERTRATLHCIVRGESVEAARQRLIESLSARDLWKEAFAGRLRVYAGDLVAGGLGLTAAAANYLGGAVDAIYHCGAHVSFVLPYSELKRANVDATLSLIELACAGKPKALHYISTLSVFDQLPYFDGRVIDESTVPELLGEPLSGYAESKWVAEQLVMEARARGLAVTIHRPGIIAGHSHTGVWNPSELIPTTIKGCLQLGAAPSLNAGVQLTPVDFVAKAIVDGSNSGLSTFAFHPVAEQETKLSEITNWLRTLGYRVQDIPYDEWRSRLRNVLDAGQENALAAVSSLFLEPIADDSGITTPELLSDARRPHYSNSQIARVLSTDSTEARIDQKTFQLYVHGWQESGYLPFPGSLF